MYTYLWYGKWVHGQNTSNIIHYLSLLLCRQSTVNFKYGTGDNKFEFVSSGSSKYVSVQERK